MQADLTSIHLWNTIKVDHYKLSIKNYMEKEVVSYVKHHSFQVIVVVVGVFIILAIGEFVLYRKTQELNQMISEGVMQIKEEVQTNETQPD